MILFFIINLQNFYIAGNLKGASRLRVERGWCGNSPLHFSAKGRTTATVYGKGGAFFDSNVVSDGFLWVVKNINV